MFTYCLNNPIANIDSAGNRPIVGGGLRDETPEERALSITYLSEAKRADRISCFVWPVLGGQKLEYNQMNYPKYFEYPSKENPSAHSGVDLPGYEGQTVLSAYFTELERKRCNEKINK